MITVLEREVLFRRTVKVININPQAGLADDCMGSVRCDRKTEMYKVNEHISPIFCIPDTHSEHRFPAPSKDVVNQCLEFGFALYKYFIIIIIITIVIRLWG